MSKADLVDAVSLALAALALALQVALALVALTGLASLVWAGARRGLAAAGALVAGLELWLAWLVALVATLGSLFYSEIADFRPCLLCWYQRIAMYPLVAVLLVAAVRRDTRGGVLYAFLLPVVGALVAMRHIYVELNPEAESASCRIGGTSCATKWIEELGYVTIPVLALTAFATILALLAAAWARRDAR